jgi:hypothetical protein
LILKFHFRLSSLLWPPKPGNLQGIVETEHPKGAKNPSQKKRGYGMARDSIPSCIIHPFFHTVYPFKNPGKEFLFGMRKKKGGDIMIHKIMVFT